MKTSLFNFLLACLFMAGALSGCESGQTVDGEYPVRPVAFTDVHITDDFWAGRLLTNKEVTVPVALHQSEITGRIKNFAIAGGLEEGDFQSDAPFDDSDVFKIIEGASYSMQMFPDPELDAYIDSLIWLIGEAQEDNGYLYTYRTIHGDDSHPWIGSKRWERTHVMSHELYNMGHMYEAAVAHYNLTGKRNFLDIAIKNADLIIEDIGPGKFETYPGHQGIEIGLVKLYNATGDRRYLDQAKYFLDARGHDHIGEPPFWHGTPRTYDQAHLPVTEQTEAVGHSVRALYMYAGMADVATLTGDREYIDAIDRLWEDIVYTKYYITGGVGSAGGHEGFGPAYDLPNLTAYCETCAGIANVFWNHRQFLLHGDAKYIDVLERTLYNNVLAGVSLDGDLFFYPNRLESDGLHTRSEWFGCACCPSNISRFIPSVPGYVYAQDDEDIYVNLFVSSESDFEINGTKTGLQQESALPWDGGIRLKVNPQEPVKFSLRVRIPGWSEDQPVPGDLYTFIDQATETPVLKVNGEAYDITRENGYAVISRTWSEGDVVDFNLPMDIRRIRSHPEVAANEGKVALQRGPLVYCAEWPEFDDNSVLDIIMAEDAPLTHEFRDDMLEGVTVLEGRVNGSRRLLDGGVETYEKDFTAIPYYAWAHRGPGEMMIWFATSQEYAQSQPAPTLAYKSTIDGSYKTKSLQAVKNQMLPRNSSDNLVSRYHWWPRNNQSEYIIYEFEQPATISSSHVYWFDEGPGAGVRLPAGWRILYKSGEEWLPVNNTVPYEITRDELNKVDFDPVFTSAVKLEVQLPEDSSAGLYEWGVE
jgi:uncharacterized protein